MTEQRRARGTTFARLAERVLDPVTVEQVIRPALADLQHECSEATASALQRWLICCRAYWGVWKTFLMCFAGDVVRDPQGGNRAVARRTLVGLTFLMLLILSPVVSTIYMWTSHLTGAEAIRLAVILLPEAVVPSLPVAFFFALALHRGTDRSPTPMIRTAIAGTLVCVLVVGVLSGVAVPKANEAFRVMIFTAADRRAADYGLPRGKMAPRGVAEMTWWELNEYIANAPNGRAKTHARARLQAHFAFLALVPVLALMGYGVSRRRHSPAAAFGIALLLVTLPFFGFSFAASDFLKRFIYAPWVLDSVFLIVAIWLVRRPAPEVRLKPDATEMVS